MVLALSVLICLVVAMTLTACQQFCTVTFKEEGISSQTVFKGGKATEPLTVRQGMRVVWYTDEALTCVFDFDDVIEKDVTLYPKWISTAPETIKVTFKNNGNVIGTLSVVKGEKFNPVFLSANNKTLEGQSWPDNRNWHTLFRRNRRIPDRSHAKWKEGLLFHLPDGMFRRS